MDLLLFIVVAIIIYYISQSFMKFEVSVQNGEDIDYNGLEIEAKLIIALMAKIAKADGRVSELEAELLSNTFTDFAETFSNPEQMREELKEIFYTEKDLDDNSVFLAQELYKLTRHQYTKRVRILEYLLNMAFIDRHLAPEEEDLLITIAENLEIRQEDFIRFLNAFKETYTSYNQRRESQQPQKDFHEVLGVAKDADFATIKKAYRRLVKENHPDIISGKGLGEEEIQKATIKLQEINEAYEELKKLHNK